MASNIEVVRRSHTPIIHVLMQDSGRKLYIECFEYLNNGATKYKAHLMTNCGDKWRSKYLATPNVACLPDAPDAYGVQCESVVVNNRLYFVIVIFRNDNGEWRDDGRFRVPQNQSPGGVVGMSHDHNSLVLCCTSYETYERSMIFYKRDARRRWRRWFTKQTDVVSAVWSPDNSKVVLVFRGYLQLVDVASKATLMQLETHNTCNAEWTSDGKYFLATTDLEPDDPVYIVLVSVATRTVVASIETPLVMEMRVSPDGRQLAVLFNHNFGIFQVPKPGDTQLVRTFVPPTPTSPYQHLWSSARRLHWFPDGKRVLLSGTYLIVTVAVVPWSPRAHYAFTHKWRTRVFALVCCMHRLGVLRLHRKLPLELVLVVCEMMV